MTVRLQLEKMVHGGHALARLPDGRVALVKGGMPGELVEAELKVKSGVLQGRVVKVLKSSPERAPASEHPGLDYSFMRYPAQLAAKREATEDALRRSLKGEVEVPALVAAPELWHYRHSIQPAVEQARLGYRYPQGREVVPLSADPVAIAPLNRAWRLLEAQGLPKGVREVVLRGNESGEVLLALIAVPKANHFVGFAHELVKSGISGVHYAPFDPRGRFRRGVERLAGRRSILQPYGPFELSVSVSSFAQPNPAAASLLFAELESWAGAGEQALDLYAGSGIVGMHLAKHFAEVTALEIDRGSVVRGERDAERLGIDNLRFVKADAKHAALPNAELITVDPPRAGLAKPVRELISTSTAERLIYVSCEVPTFARDAADLLKRGWQLARLRAYDFYPQTHHVEILSLFIR